MDATAISLASTFGFGAANMAHALTPNLSDVRTGVATDDTLRAKVRTGEAASVLIVGTTGIILWKLTGDNMPLIVSGVILGATFLAYEWALRQPAPRKQANNGNGDTNVVSILRYT